MSKGDLISREALKETITEPLNVNDAGKNDWYEGYYTAKNEDVYYIDNAPTVEPQDRWGRWVVSEIRCPNCLEYFDTGCYSKGELDKCPSCGAKMRGGAE